MSSEKFCLRWNDFETNISGAFRELRDEKDFFDVTIACENEQIQAHKVILSACSPFFRNILRRNQHQHPLLYLKGVKYTDLQSVLNFMYHGEVNVAQEELNSFLSVAEDLRVKGLTQNQGTTSASSKREVSPSRSSKPRNIEREPTPASKRPQPPPPPTRTFSPALQPSSFTRQQGQDDDIQEIPTVKTEPRDTPAYPPPAVATRDPTPQADIQHNQVVQQDQYVEEGTMGEYDDYGQYGDTSYDEGHYGHSLEQADGGKADLPDRSFMNQYVEKDASGKGFRCSLCAQQGEIFKNKGSYHIINHIESKHFPNTFVYNCDTCDKIMPTAKAHARHKEKCGKFCMPLL